MSLQYQQTDALAKQFAEQAMQYWKKMNEEEKPKQRLTFAEPNQNEMSEFGGGMFRVSSGNLLVMAIGAAFSGVVGGLISRFLPANFGIAGLPQIIAGVIGLKFFAKSGMLADIFRGVFISGIALALGGLVGSVGGGTGAAGATMFGERSTTFREPTYGRLPSGYLTNTGYGSPSGNLNRPVAFN